MPRDVEFVLPRLNYVWATRAHRHRGDVSKAAEQNLSTEVFRIAKLANRHPRSVYELEDLNRTLIDCQFYQKELTPVRVTKCAVY